MDLFHDDLLRSCKEATALAVDSEEWRQCAQAAIAAFPAYAEASMSMLGELAKAREAVERTRAVVDATHRWVNDQNFDDWGAVALLKALWTFDEDRVDPCPGCDGACEDSCAPTTVASAHARIDARLTELVRKGKLFTAVPLGPPYRESKPHGGSPPAAPMIASNLQEPPCSSQ